MDRLGRSFAGSLRVILQLLLIPLLLGALAALLRLRLPAPGVRGRPPKEEAAPPQEFEGPAANPREGRALRVVVEGPVEGPRVGAAVQGGSPVEGGCGEPPVEVGVERAAGLESGRAAVVGRDFEG